MQAPRSLSFRILRKLYVGGGAQLEKHISTLKRDGGNGFGLPLSMPLRSWRHSAHARCGPERRVRHMPLAAERSHVYATTMWTLLSQKVRIGMAAPHNDLPLVPHRSSLDAQRSKSRGMLCVLDAARAKNMRFSPCLWRSPVTCRDAESLCVHSFYYFFFVNCSSFKRATHSRCFPLHSRLWAFTLRERLARSCTRANTT